MEQFSIGYKDWGFLYIKGKTKKKNCHKTFYFFEKMSFSKADKSFTSSLINQGKQSFSKYFCNVKL